MSKRIVITDSDYPGLFQSADLSSKRAQKIFIYLNGALLLILIFSAFITDNFESISIEFTLILIISALILNLIVFYSKFEKTWYEGRAVAESLKTLSWKYMMRTKPFSENNNPNIPDNKFLDYLKELIGEKKDFYNLVGGKFSNLDQISNQMREVRSKEYEERIQIYKFQRLDTQLNWYRNKSNRNRIMKNRFFIFNIFLLFSILILLIYRFDWLENINIIAFAITLITSVIAWMQIKNYQELTHSYALTAHELGVIKSKIGQVDSEKKLDDFVDDAETAISREHTMWLARRDHLHLFNK